MTSNDLALRAFLWQEMCAFHERTSLAWNGELNYDELRDHIAKIERVSDEALVTCLTCTEMRQYFTERQEPDE